MQGEPEIVMLADEHIYAKTWQEDFNQYAIDYIKAGKNRYWMYLGDGIENNLKNSAGSVYEQVKSPKLQRRKFIEMHEPIIDKCIGFITTSNHGGRSQKEADFDVDEIFAEYFGFDLKFPTDEVNILLNDEKEHTIVYAHGASGATTLGGKITAVNRYMNNYDATLYIIGHFHTLLQWKEWQIKHNHYKEKSAMICGSFMDYFDSYGQVKNYTPTPAQFGSVILQDDGIGFNRFINSYRMYD